MKLRSYQEKWLEKILAARGKVLVVGATGSGKTVVASALMNQLAADGKRVLFVAHRRELVTQCIERLREAGCQNMGAIMAGLAKDPDKPIQVASLMSLKSWAISGFDVVVIDEAHRATAKSYNRILKANPLADVYGLTATPKRLDGRSLGDVFDLIVESDPVSELIRVGAISKPEIWSVHPADLRDIAVKRGDFARGDLSKKMRQVTVFGDVIAHWKLHASQLKTVVYCVDIKHATQVHQEFSKAGVSAALLTNETPLFEREESLRKLRSGELQMLVNIELLTEGWDCPELECALFLRPTMSETLLLQMCGRVMRGGKTRRPKILDHAGNFTRNAHLPPWEDRVWTLSETPAKTRISSPHPATKECSNCGNVLPRHCSLCWACDTSLGHELLLLEDTSVVLKPLPLGRRDRVKQLLLAGRRYRWLASRLRLSLEEVSAIADELAVENADFGALRHRQVAAVAAKRRGEDGLAERFGFDSNELAYLDGVLGSPLSHPVASSTRKALQRGTVSVFDIRSRLNLTRADASKLAELAIVHRLKRGEAPDSVALSIGDPELVQDTWFKHRDILPVPERRIPEKFWCKRGGTWMYVVDVLRRVLGKEFAPRTSFIEYLSLAEIEDHDRNKLGGFLTRRPRIDSLFLGTEISIRKRLSRCIPSMNERQVEAVIRALWSVGMIFVVPKKHQDSAA